MFKISKFYSFSVLWIVILGFATPALWGQEEAPNPIEVKNIRIGGHPDYTRIFLDLSQTGTYQIKPEFTKKKVTVFIPGSTKGEALESRAFADQNLQQIDFTNLQEGVRVTFRLKNINTRLFHYLQPEPAAIVLDFQGSKSAVPQAISEKDSGQARKKSQKKAATKDKGSSLSPERMRQIVQEDTERKIVQGFKEYQAALKAYQLQKRDEALEAFETFREKFPASPLLENVLFLRAELLFQIHNPEPFPVYEEVIDAYQLAMRSFPESHFVDHALYKLGLIFDNMNLTMEARTLYLEGIGIKKKSLYNRARQTGLARMMLREKNLDEAYRAFQEILKEDPKNEEAQKALFEIAQDQFDEGNLNKARSIFENAARRWPTQLQDQPQINHYMGEIYFGEKDYPKARKYFFDLLNLDPESKTAHQGLNKIGDSYLIEGNGMAALASFDKSQRMNPDTAESQYAKIRMADIGVRDPTLPIRDVIFDYPHYFNPEETYSKVTREAKTQNILAEVTLSKGISRLQQKRYLDAIREFKKLIPLDPTSRFHKAAQNHLQQALILLVDDYSGQQGYLPILYAYNDYRSLGLGDVHTVKTLLQIGESYQAIGMHNEALAFFERVKEADPNGVYRDRLFLNLGRIQLDQRRFPEAEVAARTFLTNFPNSLQVPEAMKVLAASFVGQNNYQAARDIYGQLLARADAVPSEAHYLTAEAWFKEGNLTQAIREYALTLDTYDRTLRQVASHVQDAYYKLGISLYQDGMYERARDALTSARRLFPGHRLGEWADFLLADSYDRLNNPDKAAAGFQDMMKSPPKEDLLKQAAEIRIKVLDWEKRFKELL